ncbi:MAG TPA: TlpA disulfide reductase family protein [Chitinophagaceae bacterium]|nr:TlpA family protein disulfide reductase [Chitinophagaceae bacterium]MCC6635227.1 TlpA family protein disulfide reductase [Chitinophagaceae bacterium]HMZ45557.1 TlpA disulfide reductase family protein [Chitinophagaceae bacterium]HNL82223.1 TlpA disulfide reductase family protein [Chitinophagaceae bacterium]HNM35054.1 TlpA disulfide reductase family protein [Chitinophagaceae bacterium]
MKKYLIVLFLFLFCLNLNAQPDIGMYSPEIRLTDVNGKSLQLSSLKGKIVLIDFWASWCGPCRAANKKLKKLYDKYKLKGFEIYAISVDYNTNAWKRAIKADKINWIQVYDENSLIANKWKVSYIPNSYLLNKEGKVVGIDLSPYDLENKIKELLQ